MLPLSLIRKYLALLRVQMGIQMEYRIVMLIWLLSGFALPLINLMVWSSIAVQRPVNGMTVADFVSYFLAVLAVDHFVAEWSGYHFDLFVREGRLSAKLLRPIDPIHELAAENIGYKVAQAMFVLPVWAFLFWLLDGTPYVCTALSIVGFIISLLLAGILNFILGYALGLITFWTESGIGLYEMLTWGVGYFLSGRMAPLSALPHWAQVLANALPFRYTIAFPIDILMGKVNTIQELLTGIGWQLAWIAIAVILWKALWMAGTRRFTAVGG